MASVKISMPTNRLGKIVEGHEGVAFDTLVAASEKRLSLMKEDLRTYIQAQIQEIVAIHALGEELMFARCRELEHAAMNIADVAGVAQLGAIGEAANGIRAMIGSLFCKGVWHTDALELHITSLLLLNTDPPPSAEETGSVLSRLRKMRAAVGVVE